VLRASGHQFRFARSGRKGPERFSTGTVGGRSGALIAACGTVYHGTRARRAGRLCRPLLARDVFTEPASTPAIAEELVVTQAAVKQHLANLYDKFGIAGADAHRRARLANAARRRGALTELQRAKDE
jgi:hypothetical protein